MNLNLSKFKKISEDKKSAVLKHPEGHQIRIAKEKLSEENQKALTKLPMHFDVGGVVPNEGSDANPYLVDSDKSELRVSPEKSVDEQLADNAKIEADKLRMGNYMGIMPLSDEDIQKKSEESALGKMASKKDEEVATAGYQAQQEAASQKQLEAAHQQHVDYINSQNELRKKIGAAPLPSPLSPSPMSPPSSQVADASSAGNVQPGGATPQLTPANQPSINVQGPETPVVGKGPIIQSDLSKPYDTAMTGIQNQLAATQGLGKVEAQQNLANEQLYKSNVEQRQKEMNRGKEILDTLHQEHQAFMEDYKNQHIDPQHYFNSMGTGQKVATAIGLVLGGFGGTGESSMDRFLKQQIDNDMKSQESEMTKKHNLISANYQQFGNIKQAEEMYQVQMKSILADQLLQQASKSGSQSAMLNAQNMAGKLQYEASQHLQSIAFQQMANEQMKQGMNADTSGKADNTANLINMYRLAGKEELAKSLEQRYVPSVGLAKVPVPEAVREQIQGRQNLDNKIQELIKFTKANEGTTWDRAKVAKGEAMVKLLTDAYRQANKQGVFKESEKDFVGGFLKEDPTAFFAKFRTLPGYQQVHQDNLETLNSLKKSVGLPTPYAPSSAAPYTGRK